MKFASTLLLAPLVLGGCQTVPPMPGHTPEIPLHFNLLTGEAALEPAFVRVSLIDETRRQGYGVQALPAAWDSAVVRLHATDGKLTADRVATLNRVSEFGGGNSTGSAVFTRLRPGTYVFQVTLFTGPNATGTSAAVHTLNVNLAGGTNTAITVTMKTTDGTGANGGTSINTTVDDATGFIRATGTDYNSVEGGPAGVPVIVAGDTLILDPQLADSTATGGGSTSGTSTATAVADLDPGVLSRVVVSYVKASVTPTTAVLDPAETHLTDWVRSGNEPIRAITWTSLANGTDGNTWPAGSDGSRTGSGTFGGTFNWNTTAAMFTDPAPFADESALAENYRLVYRYFDNTYGHNLIRIRTLPMAVVSPASINLTVN